MILLGEYTTNYSIDSESLTMGEIAPSFNVRFTDGPMGL